MAAFGGLLAVVTSGCGGTGDLSGKVSYKGKPLKGGYVTFVHADGPTFTSVISEDGQYSIPRMSSGAYKVTVETESLKGTASGPPQAGPSLQQQKGRPGGGPAKGAGGPPAPDDKQLAKGKSSITISPENGLTPGPSPAALKEAAKERYIQIPQDYSKPETTKLSYTFSGGTKVYDIDLQ